VKTELETARLRLRPFQGGDLDGLTSMFSDPIAMRYLGGPRDRERCLNDLRKYVATWELHGAGPLAVVRKNDERLLGRSGLWPCKVDGVIELEVGYFIERESWGQGYATEACQAVLAAAMEHGIDRVVALVALGNIASIRVAEKSGLTFEKTTMIEADPLQLYVNANR
jgi:RimJ/RimL family protein N-acetyltransferase